MGITHSFGSVPLPYQFNICSILLATVFFSLRHFGHWNILVISPTVAFKLAVTAFIIPDFQTLWPNWLNFFRSFKRIRSENKKWPKKQAGGKRVERGSSAATLTVSARATGRLYRTVAGKSSTGGLYVCAGGLNFCAG